MKDFKQVFNTNFDTDVGYLVGKARNEDVDGDGTGSPWHQIVINDLMMGPVSALFDHSDVVADNSDEKAGQSQWIDALKTLAKDMNWGDRFKGSFAKGFTYTSADDVGRGQDGGYYKYIGSDPFPKSVPAGTNPVSFPSDYNITKKYDVTRSMLVAQGLSGNYGFFEKGFIYNEIGDAGIDVDGNIYTYEGSDPLPVTVAAGTDPVGDSDYNPIVFNKASHVNLDQNGTVQDAINYITPEMFGAVEGYSIANHIALENMILDGRPVSWGDKIYELSEKISVNITHAINWRSDGCTLVYQSSSSHVESFFDVRLTGLDHRIYGRLCIDVNQKANKCFDFENISSVHAGSFIAEGLEALNYRRTSDFIGGDGVKVSGGFIRIKLVNPKAHNGVMTSGSGISGAQGIRGLYLGRSVSGTYPLVMEVESPDVDLIYSEDLDYQWDQDGIVLFGGIESGDTPSFAKVTGGRVKNCYGRGVKVQATDGLVQGVTFERDQGLNDPKDSEVDFLYGGGSIKDIQHKYSNTTPDGLYNGSTSSVINSPALTIRDVKCTLATPSNINLSRIVSFIARKAGIGSNNVIDNVQVIGGEVAEGVAIRIIDNSQTFTISNLKANFTSRAFSVLAVSKASNPSCNVSCQNVENTGVVVPLYYHQDTGLNAYAKVNTYGSIGGFLSTGGSLNSTSEDAPIVQVCDAIQGNYDRGGSLKFKGGRVAGNSEFRFPIETISNASIINIILGGVDTTAAVLVTSNAGIDIISGGTGLTNGKTSNPATGSYRVWIDDGDFVFYNATGTVRSFTCTVLG